MKVREVKYHRDEWIARGGPWIIECENCVDYGPEFLVGYPTRQDAGWAAAAHVCQLEAVRQVERGDA